MNRIQTIFLIILLTITGQGTWANDLEKQNLKGKVKRVVTINEQDTSTITLYNLHGYVTEDYYYMQNRRMYCDTYTYGVDGLLLACKSTSWRTVYTFNDKKQLTETNRYKVDDGSLMERMLFLYTKDGKDSITISYAGSGKMNYTNHITETKNKRTEVSYDADGKIYNEEEYTYDKNHHIITHQRRIAKFGEKDKTIYAYSNKQTDKNGNWQIQEIKRKSGGNLMTVKRVIEYY